MNPIAPGPLAIYIHIPFCIRRCRYCSFVSFAGKRKLIGRYVRALEKEMEMRSRSQPVHSVYFGGGTPSLLNPEQVRQLMEALARCYMLEPEAEITLEVNPGSIGSSYFELVREAGINRLSIGVQSLENSELEILGRIHDVTQALSSVQDAQKAGFTNISIDLMYGLPLRAADSWRKILTAAVQLPVTHISLYPLTLDPATSMGREVAAGKLTMPPEETVADEYELASELLNGTGYLQYELSNWARPGYAGLHNLAYWKRTSYLGLGIGAHSFEPERRMANEADLKNYIEAVESEVLPPRTTEDIDAATALAETLILALRLNTGVSFNDVRRKFGVNLRERYASEIADLEALGLVTIERGRMCLTMRGRLLGNEVFLRFLP